MTRPPPANVQSAMARWNITEGWDVMKRKVDKTPAAPQPRWRRRTGHDTGQSDRVTEALQRAYSSMLHEPVPQRLLRLFKQIERREKDP